MKRITIAIQCHNFQRRLCLMLSSILEQDPGDYEIVVDISYLANNGKPSTEQVVDLFLSKGLNIKKTVYDSIDRFQFRGYTRNDQIASCTTDYLLFADTDMVYHPEFFKKLIKTITTDEKYVDYDGMFIAGRYSQPNSTIETTNSFVNNLLTDEAKCIEDIYEKLSTSLENVKRRSVGAGFFQLIDMNKCNHSGYYVPEGRSRDRGWKGSGQKAKSDMQFRRRIGKKIQLPSWYGESQWHVNHFRDNMFGYHLDEQR